MTGKHTGHAEIRGNQPAKVKLPQFTEGQHPISEQVLTLPQVFRNAGYATGAMGKWGLGPVGSTGDPNRKGFDLFVGYNCQAVAHSYYPSHIWRNANRIAINRKPIPGHQKQPEGEVRLDDWIGEMYAPKLMVAEAVKFIEANRAAAVLPVSTLHRAARRHAPTAGISGKVSRRVGHATVPRRGRLSAASPSAGRLRGDDLTTRQPRRTRDRALDRAGIADRTLVVFTSDNGTTHPRPTSADFHVGGVDAKFFNSTAGLRGYKGSVYEGGIRVPMIVRLPGHVKAGAVSDTPGYFADWFATMCDAAGLNKPAGLDGESLWPVITGESAVERRKPMVWVFPEYGGQVAVRIGDFKIIRQGLKTNAPKPWEVYDLSKDPSEQHDLASKRSDLIEQAKETLRREVEDNAVFPLTIPTF